MLRKKAAQLLYYFVPIIKSTTNLHLFEYKERNEEAAMEKEKEKISNAEISVLGIEDLDLLIQFSRVANGLLKHGVMDKPQILANLEAMIDDPMPYALKQGGKFKNLADRIIELRQQGKFIRQPRAVQELKKELTDFPVYGAEHIEAGAMAQMRNAIQLPIAMAGALMPDAHQGYGLPIGGVLATTADTIIPYAVGVDIACRMCLSIFELPAGTVDTKQEDLKSLLLKNTFFGMGSESKKHDDDTLFDQPEWKATKQIRNLRDKAYRQLGTSGTGNHFVEWGELTVTDDVLAGVPAGSYLALLSHSGSRGFGAGIASYYSEIAMKKTLLPKEARHLAWLDLNSDEGQEYWIAMNLAGDYASANHHEIHRKIAKAMQLQPLLRIENHHNFAWQEQLADGTPVMVHRKGATPAGKGVLGIIPGSMSTPGFVVRGKGNPESINSASHGAGRVMSRSAAFKTLQRDLVQAELHDKKITLLGSDLDEAPQVYKNIHAVMEAQHDLVDVLAQFQPRIVRMAEAKERPED